MNEQIVNELISYKSENKFPLASWELRGLNPSPNSTIKLMNEDVNQFIDFIIPKIKSSNLTSENLTEDVQEYIDDIDWFDFDTEEKEWVADEYFTVIKKTGIELGDLLI